MSGIVLTEGSTPSTPSTGKWKLYMTSTGLKYIDDAGNEYSPLSGSAIGVSVQAYDADTAKLDVAQTFTASQRGTVTTDNDLSFDLSAGNNFSCTPTADGTLTFTNHTAGQSGLILLDNSGGHTISAAATTKVDSGFLAAVSAAGVYLLTYFDNGTNAYVVASKALS